MNIIKEKVQSSEKDRQFSDTFVLFLSSTFVLGEVKQSCLILMNNEVCGCVWFINRIIWWSSSSFMITFMLFLVSSSLFGSLNNAQEEALWVGVNWNFWSKIIVPKDPVFCKLWSCTQTCHTQVFTKNLLGSFFFVSV